MDKIKIYSLDRASCIELPRIKDIQVGDRRGGQYRKDGVRQGRKRHDRIPLYGKSRLGDYIPASTLRSRCRFFAAGFLLCEYPTPTGDASGVFEIRLSDHGAFSATKTESRCGMM
jgi:hypothetical protein